MSEKPESNEPKPAEGSTPPPPPPPDPEPQAPDYTNLVTEGQVPGSTRVPVQDNSHQGVRKNRP